jgi:hypothetical protein
VNLKRESVKKPKTRYEDLAKSKTVKTFLDMVEENCKIKITR